jgi:hypothetical protein
MPFFFFTPEEVLFFFVPVIGAVPHRACAPGFTTQFTCFTSTKVQILTPEEVPFFFCHQEVVALGYESGMMQLWAVDGDEMTCYLIGKKKFFHFFLPFSF